MNRPSFSIGIEEEYQTDRSGHPRSALPHPL